MVLADMAAMCATVAINRGGLVFYNTLRNATCYAIERALDDHTHQVREACW